MKDTLFHGGYGSISWILDGDFFISTCFFISLRQRY